MRPYKNDRRKITNVTTKKNLAINHVIIIIYRPGRLLGSPRDDANVPTTIHNPQTAHSTIAKTRFCSDVQGGALGIGVAVPRSTRQTICR